MNFTVASMALVSFHSDTTSALDSGLDNGLQTVENRGNLKFYIKLHYKFQKFIFLMISPDLTCYTCDK